jgi:hypothetical protein
MKHAPETASIEPVEPTGEVARKNVVMGIALTFVALVIVLGTVLVSLIYLHYD